METSKLYKEIESILNQSKREEQEYSLVYNVDVEVAAKLIEQLFIDKMEGFTDWLIGKNFEFYDDLSNGKNYSIRGEFGLYTTKEIIQLYLNK